MMILLIALFWKEDWRARVNWDIFGGLFVVLLSFQLLFPTMTGCMIYSKGRNV